MSIFDVSEDIKQEEERDVIAGQAQETDIYPAKIKIAFLDKSKKGANCLNLTLDIAGVPYSETIYFTNKEGKNFYVDKKSGDKRLMPGFSQISNMCELLVGKKFGQMAMEEKQVKVWDPEQKKEVTAPRKVLTELLGINCFPAIMKIVENKQVKGTLPNGNEGYVNDPTGATREKNEIKKWFDEAKRTLPEKKADKDAKFHETWLKANKGKVIDKVEKVLGAPAAGEATTEDLFGADD